MKFKFFALVIFLFGAALLTNSIIKSHKIDQNMPVSPKSFVIHYLASRSDDGSSPTPYEYRVRAVSFTGEWKETRYSFNGKVFTWGGGQDAIHIVAKGYKQYFGENNLDLIKNAMRSEEGLKKHPQLTGAEQIAGLKAYLLRDSRTGIETAYSPETGVTTLKEVVKDLNTGNIIHVVESLKIEFRELSEDEIRLPNLPIRFDVAEQKLRSLRNVGNHQQADKIEEGISKFRLIMK